MSKKIEGAIGHPILVHFSRLIQLCQFDLLLQLERHLVVQSELHLDIELYFQTPILILILHSNRKKSSNQKKDLQFSIHNEKYSTDFKTR